MSRIRAAVVEKKGVKLEGRSARKVALKAKQFSERNQEIMLALEAMKDTRFNRQPYKLRISVYKSIE